MFVRINIPFNFVSLYVFLIKAFQGADIDIRVVRDGRGPDCNVWSNFEQVISCCYLQSASCTAVCLEL